MIYISLKVKWWCLPNIGENKKWKWRWHRYHWKWKWCCLPTRWRDKCLSCSPLSVSTTRRDTHAPLKHLTIIRWEDHDDVMLILWWWCGIEIMIIWWYYDGDVVIKSQWCVILCDFSDVIYFQDFKSCRYRFSVVVEELREAKASEYRWETEIP